MSNEPVLIRCRECRTLNRVSYEKLSAHPVCGKCKTPLEFPRVPVNATTATLEHEIFDWPEYVLLEFWAKWCGYCRMIEPILNDLASWRAGRLKIVRVDIDIEPGPAKQYMVKATPTLVMFKNGIQLGRMDGAPREKIQLVQWVDQFVK